MADNKLSLLNEELDEESQKFITETLNSWKEDMMSKLMEEVEKAKQAKIDELEEQNTAYREELKEEYSDKLISALNDLRESVKAEVTANVLRENPEIKILAQIKDLVAPLIDENYTDNTYSNTIATLSEENEKLRRNEELMEGAKTLSELLAPYNEQTQKLVLSLIKEGNSEEVTEQFYNILEGLQEAASEDDDEDDESESEGDEDEKGKKKDDDDDEDEEEDSDDDDEDETTSESYLGEDFAGLDDDDDEKPANRFAQQIANMANF